MPTRTKAELVATFVVAYCVLLATAPDLAHWASTRSLIARIAPCPVNPVRVGCAHRAWPGARPERSARSREVRITTGRANPPQVQAPARPVSGLTATATPAVRASLANVDRSSSSVRVEVASLRGAKRQVVARAASLSHARQAAKRARSIHRRARIG